MSTAATDRRTVEVLMYKNMLLPVIVERDEDGYFVYCPSLQGCYTQGDSFEEAMANIQDAIQLHIADRLADGEPITERSFVSIATVEVSYEPTYA